MVFNNAYLKAAFNFLKINYNKKSTIFVNVFVCILTLFIEVSEPV